VSSPFSCAFFPPFGCTSDTALRKMSSTPVLISFPTGPSFLDEDQHCPLVIPRLSSAQSSSITVAPFLFAPMLSMSPPSERVPVTPAGASSFQRHIRFSGSGIPPFNSSRPLFLYRARILFFLRWRSPLSLKTFCENLILSLDFFF